MTKKKRARTITSKPRAPRRKQTGKYKPRGVQGVRVAKKRRTRKQSRESSGFSKIMAAYKSSLTYGLDNALKVSPTTAPPQPQQDVLQEPNQDPGIANLIDLQH